MVLLCAKARWRKQDQARPDIAPDPERLHRLLAYHGIDVTTLEPFPPPRNPLARSNPVYAGLDPWRTLVVLTRFRHADVVVSVFESGAIFLLLLRRLFRLKAKIILWDASVGNRWWPKRLAMRLVLPRVDHVFALTHWQAGAAAAKYRLRAPAEVIGYAVDECFYHPRFNEAPDIILTVGDDAARDYATFLAAMRGVPASVVLKTSRAVTIADAGSASFTVNRSFVTARQLRDLYARASVFVLPLQPSDNPGGITSLFEAMAMGKAIVASDVPMIREFVAHNETAWLVPVGDSDAMEGAVRRLIASPEVRARLGAAARAHLEAVHGMDSFARRLAVRLGACVRNPHNRTALVRDDILLSPPHPQAILSQTLPSGKAES